MADNVYGLSSGKCKIIRAVPAIVATVDMDATYDVYVFWFLMHTYPVETNLDERKWDSEFVDISNPTQSPVCCRSGIHIFCKIVFYVSGSLAYVADSFGGLKVVDVSNPFSPAIVGEVKHRAILMKSFISGPYVLRA